MTRSKLFTVIRLGFSLILAGRGLYILATADGLWSSVPRLLFGIGAIVLASLLMAPTIADLLANPWCIIYYPKRKIRKSDLKGLEDISFRRRWFEEVPFTEPENRPDQDIDLSEVLDSYVEQIKMAVDDLRNEEMGRAILDEALLVFRKTDDQITLRSAFIGACRAVERRENPDVFTPPDLT